MTQPMQPMQGMMPNQAAAQPTQFQYAQGQDPSAPAQMMAPGMAPGMVPGMPQGMAPGAAPGNPAVPNGGMLYITAPAAEPEPTENTGNGEPPADPRIYRPRVTKKNKTYTATVRPLPNGTNFASYPYVCVKYHYIRDLVTGKLLIAKCCQNPTKTPDGKIIPGVDKFSCPFCQDVWNRRKAAKEAGADDNTLKKYLQMLPEDVWYGNALIISDENHNDLAGQVKLWEMNKFQHTTLQEPVTEFNKRTEAIKEGKQYFDKGNCFIPYDPVQGRNYQIVGVWDEKKTMGNGKKGAPTYKESGFAGYSSMLAIKNVLARADRIETQVFDEVDTGSGAVTGRLVGRKLNKLAKDKQIFCITHLAQVAAYGSRHYFVRKTVKDGIAAAQARILSDSENEAEIARMIGGKENADSISLEHARKLIEECKGENL